jgi:uncharacterized membrane protein YraQ (UPF0718 family)
MKSHFVLLAVFAFFVSSVFAALMREEFNEQLTLAAKMFGGMLVAAILLGWMMLPFPT